MTYHVSRGTLNPTIPYHAVPASKQEARLLLTQLALFR